MPAWRTENGLTTDQWILVAQLGVFALQAAIFWRQVSVAKQTAADAAALSSQIAKDAGDLQRALVRPYVGLDFEVDVKNTSFRFSVINGGSGAALIREMRPSVDGQRFIPKSGAENVWQELIQSLQLPPCNVRTAAALPPGGYILVPGNSAKLLVAVDFLSGSIPRDTLLGLGKRIGVGLKIESTLGEVLAFQQLST
jgi:hypothetical protein